MSRTTFGLLFALSTAICAQSSNLIRNGSAEAGDRTNGNTLIATVSDWTSVDMNVMDYVTAGAGGWPSPTDPGPVNRGRTYFGGWTTAVGTATQTIDVSSGAAGIDTGMVNYDLSAWLGGYASQDDWATLTADFQDGSGSSLLSDTIGPVTKTMRGNITSLLLQSNSGTVPVLTRTVVITLTATRFGNNYNDGYADNLSLTMTPDPFASLAPSSTYIAGQGNTDAGANGTSSENFTINDSVGDLNRFVTANIGQDLTLRVTNPFVSQSTTHFLLFGTIGAATTSDLTTLPLGIGVMCFQPWLLYPTNPNLFTLADSVNGTGLLPATAAEWQLLIPGGIPSSATLTLQGVVLEGSTITLTNAMVLSVQ